MLIKPGDRPTTTATRALSGYAAKLGSKSDGGALLKPTARDAVTISSEARAQASTAEQANKAETGRSMVLARLFHTDDASAEPKVETAVTNASGSVYGYLNRQDRSMLAEAYEFASAQGMDPVEVDNLAFDLAAYRMKAPTGGSPDTTGTFRDPQSGQLLINEFTPEDEATSRSILASTAMSDTKVDHEFLNTVLHPGRSPAHAVDLKILRQVVVGLSPSHADGATDSSVSFADRDARLTLAGAVKALPASTGRASQHDGGAIMASRLFQAGQTSGATARAVTFLSDEDKNMLGNLYAQAEANGADLREVDKAAKALGAIRMNEALLKSQTSLLHGSTQDADQSAYDRGLLRDLVKRVPVGQTPR